MSDYYNSQRTKNLYDSEAKEPYKISRSGIDLFLNCPRCFYYDKKLGVIYKQKLTDLEELKKSVLKSAFAGKM